MPKFLVAHPHMGYNGRRRTPGEVVQIGEDEAAVRSRDGFGRVVSAAEAEARQKAAAAETGSMAAPPAKQEPAKPDEPERPQPPKMSAPRTVWIEYLAQTGKDPAELQPLTRGQLIDLAQLRT